MLDDYKYSIGRLVVYKHTEPKLPRQSYGHYGSERTVGEVIDVVMDPTPEPHWVYTLRNVRNQENVTINEEDVKFATMVGRYWKKSSRKALDRKLDGALAEMIAKALANPDRVNLLNSTLREIIHKEETEAKVCREGADLPVFVDDYIRVRGDLRKEAETLHNQYAKILSVEPSDIAGIENPLAKPGQSRIYRTLKKYGIVTPDGEKAEIYDVEIKVFYSANGRKTILDWRATTLLAESFGDQPPYNLDYGYLADHIFTREELQPKSRAELAQMLASLLYVKGRLGWRDYQRRNQLFAATPKSHLLDDILAASRFDYRRNRDLTNEEITQHQQQAFRLQKLLKG